MSSPRQRLFRGVLVLVPALATAPFVLAVLSDALLPVPGGISRSRTLTAMWPDLGWPGLLPFLLAAATLLAVSITGVVCAARNLRTRFPARVAATIGMAALFGGTLAGVSGPTWVWIRACLGIALASFVLACGFRLLLRSPTTEES